MEACLVVRVYAEFSSISEGGCEKDKVVEKNDTCCESEGDCEKDKDVEKEKKKKKRKRKKKKKKSKNSTN